MLNKLYLTSDFKENQSSFVGNLNSAHIVRLLTENTLKCGDLSQKFPFGASPMKPSAPNFHGLLF